MSIMLVGRKCGMTRIFDASGKALPVTVVEVLPNVVTQVKTTLKDGYNAIQVTTGQHKVSRVTKPVLGHYKKADILPGRGLWEFRLEACKDCPEENDFKTGDKLTVTVFKEGQYIDVSGITKGKGFAGVIKRHHCHGQNASHGVSLSHRAVGSIGQRRTPGWVAKGQVMPGHLGNKKRTIQMLKVVKVDEARNLLLIQGAIPGAPGRDVIILPSSKIRQGGEL